MFKKVLLSLFLVLSSASFANSNFLSGVSVGAGVGLLNGLNMQLGYRFPRSDSFIKNRFGFRVEYNTWAPIKDKVSEKLSQYVKVDGNEFTPSIDGSNFGALVDFYPFGSTWLLGNLRIVGGYYFGKFDLGGTLHKNLVGQTFSIGGIDYKLKAAASGQDPEMLLNAKLKSKVSGPYLGMGFDLSLFMGLKLSFDSGVVFIPTSDIETSVSGKGKLEIAGVDFDLANTTIPQLNKLLEDTAEQYKSQLGNIKNYYPMVKLGLLYRF